MRNNALSRYQILLRLLGGLILFAGSVSIVRTTAAQGTDFYVFWKCARLVWSGEPLYSTARDAGMVFKYPPWILPFFFPLAPLSLEAAKWVWGFTELASLIYIVRWLQNRVQLSLTATFFSLALYWGLWIVHALDGQIALPMLALALWGWSQEPKFNVRTFALFTGLTTKIFTVFPLAGLRWSRRTWQTAVFIGLTLLALSIPAILAQPDHSPISLFMAWKDAAVSAGRFMSLEHYRGKFNPGLPGYTLWLLQVPASRTSADVITAVIYALVLGFAWTRISRKFSAESRWLGWLALTPVVHPLPWWHLYVLTFPLAAYAMDRSFKEKDPRAKLMSVLGILLIGVSTESVWGRFGVFLEFNAAKSWGTLLSLASLSLMERRRAGSASEHGKRLDDSAGNRVLDLPVG